MKEGRPDPSVQADETESVPKIVERAIRSNFAPELFDSNHWMERQNEVEPLAGISNSPWT
jgi:hypothetical protein